VRFGTGHDFGQMTRKSEVIGVARIVSGWPTTRPPDWIGKHYGVYRFYSVRKAGLPKFRTTDGSRAATVMAAEFGRPKSELAINFRMRHHLGAAANVPELDFRPTCADSTLSSTRLFVW
jgi:hypothetical protein